VCNLLGLVTATTGQHIDIGRMLAVAAEKLQLTICPPPNLGAVGLVATPASLLSAAPTPNSFLSLDGLLPVDAVGVSTSLEPEVLEIVADAEPVVDQA
jgi:hypothetical protein